MAGRLRRQPAGDENPAIETSTAGGRAERCCVSRRQIAAAITQRSGSDTVNHAYVILEIRDRSGGGCFAGL